MERKIKGRARRISTNTQVRVDPALWERLKSVAEKNKRSANAETEVAIEAHVEREEKKGRL